MNKNILSIFWMFFYCLTYSQIDQFNLTNNTKFDSLLTIKKQVDKKLFDKNYYSMEVIIWQTPFQNSLLKNTQLTVRFFILKLQTTRLGLENLSLELLQKKN